MRVIWDIKLGGKISAAGTIGGGRVFVGSWDNRLYALDKTTGNILWSFPTECYIAAKPVIAGHMVVAGSYDGSLYALNAETGDLVWNTKRTGNSSWHRAGAAFDGKRLYAGTCDNKAGVGYLRAFSHETGDEIWRFETRNWICTIPVCLPDRIVFGSVDGHAYCVDSADGRGLWRFRAGTRLNYDEAVVTGSIHTVSVLSSPAVDEDSVYIGADDGCLWKLDTQTGGVKWVFQTKGIVAGGPLISDELVIFGSYDGRITALERDSGVEVWSIDSGAPVMCTPASDGRLVYFVNLPGDLFAVEQTTGEVKDRADLGATSASPVVSEGRVYIGLASGNFLALDFEE